MFDLFTQLTVIIVLASLLGIIARWLRQPTILAYLSAGVLVGFLGYSNLAENKEIFDVFSDLGIMFLLFLVGLEINYISLRVVGRDSVFIGLGQVLFTFIVGFILVSLFDFNLVYTFYIALALTFSSTIIVVNLLSEKKDLNNVYGKISLGILLVQDFIVVLALVVLAGLGKEQALLGIDYLSWLKGSSTVLRTGISVCVTLLKGLVVFVVAFYASRSFIPKLFNTIARSPELIFLTSLAWLFALTSLVDWFGFSKEIGGFLAGLTLANSYENFQIANRIKSLKDFFILVFFVILGSSVIVFSNFSGLLVPIIVLSLFVLVGNPLIVFFIMTALGYKKRVSFMAGITTAQVSEFSMILAALGLKIGHINDSVATLITAVAVITILVSTYMIVNAHKIYGFLSPALSRFERKKTKYTKDTKDKIGRPILLVGFNRTGKSIAYNLPKDHILVVDYDPEIYDELERSGFEHIFGDMTDRDVLSQIYLKNTRTVISTSPDLDSNLLFLKEILDIRDRTNGRFRVLVRARTDKEAEILYRQGADYCLLPHMTSGRYLAKILATDPYLQTLSDMKKKDMAILRMYRPNIPRL